MLFEVIPDHFFRVFSGPRRHINAYLIKRLYNVYYGDDADLEVPLASEVRAFLISEIRTLPEHLQQTLDRDGAPPSPETEGHEFFRKLVTSYKWLKITRDLGKKYVQFTAVAHSILDFFMGLATSLIAGKGAGKTIRKFSTESVRDSKFVGDHQSKIQRLLVAYYGFEPETAPDFLSKLGLGTPAAPVFISGRLKAVYDGHAGIDVGEVPFVGLPTNGVFSPALAVKAVLTIENWESFYRHIVEVPEREVIVLYTGGFASVETTSILEKLISAGLDWFHWGDIDPYGLAIIQALEGAVGQPSKPHLMSLERLQEIGAWADRPANAKVLQDLADRDGWMQDLAQYFLSEDRTRWLEQEIQDPEPIFRPLNVKPVENPPSEKPRY